MFAVFTNKVSPRLRYVLEEVLGRRLGKSVQLCFDEDDYLDFTATQRCICLKYLEEDRVDLPGIFIQSVGPILNQGFLEMYEPEVGDVFFSELEIEQICGGFRDRFEQGLDLDLERFVKEPFRVLFKSETELGFDPFSFAFYCLSRYEEYFDFNGDTLNRFSQKNSIGYRQNWGLLPYLDLALMKLYFYLGLKLKDFYGFKIQPTLDIDIAYRFLGRPILRQLGSIIKYPRWFIPRFKTYITRRDSFSPDRTIVPYLHHLQGNSVERPRIFILCSEKDSTYNKQVMRTFGSWKQDILKLGDIAELGLHPSLNTEITVSTSPLFSTGNVGKLNNSHLHTGSLRFWQDEKLWLERVSGCIPITHSRQHYIHLLMPETYRQLLQLGIQHDWSMGYAQDLGYRAGTGRSFFWYDLLDDAATTLLVHPFSVMDVTLKNYMGVAPIEAYKITYRMKQFCALIGIPFTFIVHNESLSGEQGWEGWLDVFLSWRDDFNEVKNR